MEPTIEYTLLAQVDGEVVYKQSSQVLEVIEQSLLDAERAVKKETEEE